MNEIIKKYINKDFDVEQVTLFFDEATDNSVLFYNLEKSEVAQNTFERRYNECKNSPLIITSNPSRQKYNNVFAVSDTLFMKFQYELLKDVYPIINRPKVYGITGTNGKTTVVSLIEQILNQQNKKAISIGTLGVQGCKTIDIKNNVTTPPLITFWKLMFELQNEVNYIAVEISSHALDQNRLFGIELDNAAFTNISQDHLNYHNSMDDYFRCKLKIKDQISKTGLLYIPYSQRELFSRIDFERKKKAMIFDEQNLISSMQIDYNLENLSLALEMVSKEIDFKKINFSKLRPPRGRLDEIQFKNKKIFIDYAHSPGGLESVCASLKKLYKTIRLVVIFGCGGDREKSKRPLMGQAVSKFADKIVVTSDNPRTEDPEKIIDDIIPGLSSEYVRESNRDLAITKTILDNSDEEIILIAGKGHEEYQEIKGVKHPFSDFDVVERIINEKN